MPWSSTSGGVMKRLATFVLALSLGAGVLSAATTTPTPPCPQILPQFTATPYAGVGKPGDILVTLRNTAYILGYDIQADSWYVFTTAAAVGNLDGITVVPTDPSKFLVTMESLDRVDLIDSYGNTLGTY